MPIKVGFSEEGIKELDARLQGIDRSIAKEALQQPLKESAAPFVSKWKELAPQPGKSGYTGPGRGRKKGIGGLSDAIQEKVVAGKDGYLVFLVVGADYSIAPHEHLVERGHDIIVNRNGRRAIGRIRQSKFVGSVSAMKKDSRRVGKTKVPGGWYGRKAQRSTQTQREAILLERIGREIDRIAKA